MLKAAAQIVLNHATSKQAIAIASMFTISHAITTSGIAIMSQSTAIKSAAVMYHSIMKNNAAGMFHNTIHKHAAAKCLSITIHAHALIAQNTAVKNAANMFPKLIGSIHAHQLVQIPALQHVTNPPLICQTGRGFSTCLMFYEDFHKKILCKSVSTKFVIGT